MSTNSHSHRFRFAALAALAALSMAACTPTEEEGEGAVAGDVTTTTAAETKMYPGRVDSQEEDQERAIGQDARLSGYTATVTEAGFQQTLSQFQRDGYIVATVTVSNRDDRAQAYNLFDWKLQSPSGTVIDPSFTTIDGLLGSGDLVKDGTVTGKVPFEIGSAKGDYYLIYKPDPFDSARGIWKVTV